MNDFEPRPIVVGIDGSPASKAALRWAVDEAELRGCAVEAILGWHRDFGMAVGAVPIDLMIGMLPDELRDAQQRILDEVVGEIDTKVEIRTVAAAEDARRALTKASEHASLLVVGSRGAGPIASALLGSVSTYCVHHASCPVVVLRDDDAVVPESYEPITPGLLL